ncbi:MAG: hypothetical protein WD069_22885 [Planctomycetales bacterium]
MKSAIPRAGFRRVVVGASLVLSIALSGGDSSAAEPDSSRETIAALEAELFDAELNAERLAALLADLKVPTKREAAKAVLARDGLRHISEIIEFARDCTDLEARHACADIVEALDASYRTTETGRKLAESYRARAAELLPAAWEGFRKDPSDHRSVAVLMAVDPKAAYEWLQRHGERHDPARFLLLRIREFGRDEFAFDHLRAHSVNAIRVALRNVYPFPYARGNLPVSSQIGEVHAEGFHRVVGHTALKRFAAFGRVPPPNSDRGDALAQRVDEHQPLIETADVDSRWVCICRYASAFEPGQMDAAWLRLGTATYSSNRGRLQRVGDTYERVPPSTSPGTTTIAVTPPFPMLARVPEARLSRTDQQINGGRQPLRWMRPLLPAAYRPLVSSAAANAAGPIPASVPREVEVLDVAELPDPRSYFAGEPRVPADDAPTVIILPAHFSGSPRAAERLLADAVTDHLAAALHDGGIARIVDRNELDRVLRERDLSDRPAAPLRAYDLMLRLHVDTERFAPRARLSLIDLSTGSIHGEVTASWPLRPEDLKRWVAGCRASVAKRSEAVDERIVKVRLTPTLNVTGAARIQPLAERMVELLRESLSRSPRVRIVEHLEAATAKEESLLLLMGLSRPAEGSRFEPEADYTVELRIEERDARGKTFEATPIELGLRVRARSEAEPRWQTYSGTVGELDALVLRAWSDISGRIDQAPPRVAESLLADFDERRRQARIELEAIDKAADASEAARRGAAALKLDPASEPIHHAYLQALRREAWELHSQPGALERAGRLLAEYRAYSERFGDRARHTTEVGRAALVSSPPLMRLHLSKAIALDDEMAELIENMKFALEMNLSIPALDRVKATEGSFGESWQEFVVVQRAMHAFGRPEVERDAWVDEMLAMSERQATEIAAVKAKSIGTIPTAEAAKWLRRNHLTLALAAASLALDEGRPPRARRLATLSRELAERYGINDRPESGTIERVTFQATRRLFLLFDDPEFLGELDRIFGPARVPAQSLAVRFASPGDPLTRERGENPFVHLPYFREDSGPTGSAIWPLARTSERLYVLLHTRPVPRVSYIPLNDDGSPRGKVVPGRPGRKAWDTVTQLPPLPLRPESELPIAQKELRITGACYWRERLFVGTTQHGLLIFDPANESWSALGPPQGLPGWSVDSLFPLDDDTLYCTTLLKVGTTESRDEAHFTLDFPAGGVTIVHRTDRDRKRFYEYRFEAIWKNGEKWTGWSGTGPVGDIFDPDPRPSDADFRSQYARRNERFRFVPNLAEVGGRRFVWRNYEVCEIDVDGRIIRSWRGWRDRFVYGWQKLSVDKASESPFRSPLGDLEPPLAVVGDYLAILSGGVTLFDPKTETWFGPIGTSASCGYGTDTGLWTFSEFGQGVSYASLKDVLAAAEAAGNVFTPESYRERKRAFVEQAEPFDEAIYRIGEREFDRAHALLKQLDADDPNRPDVLLLLGGLHEAKFVAPHAAAEDYFLGLARHKDSQAAYSGLRRLAEFYQANKRWRDALDCLERIRDRFELDSSQARELEDVRKQVARRVAAIPAEERPRPRPAIESPRPIADQPVRLLKPTWPEVDAVEDEATQPPWIQIHTLDKPGQPLDGDRNWRWYDCVPLVEGDDRLYVRLSVLGRSEHRLASLPIDARGRPMGDAQPVEDDPLRREFRAITPMADKRFLITASAFVGGRLIVGTRSHGLIAFDPKEERWSPYGPEQGLPALRVDSITPFGDGRLLCGADIDQRPVYYVFDAATGEVTLLQRTDRSKGIQFLFDVPVKHAWLHDGKLRALSMLAFRDDLLDAAPSRHKYPTRSVHGWRAEFANQLGTWAADAAELDGRHYYTTWQGLFELDPGGRPLRNWLGRHNVLLAGSAWKNAEIELPGKAPAFRSLTKAGGLLVSQRTVRRLPSSGAYSVEIFTLTGFDPRTETWFGPLRIPSPSIRGGRGGVWFAGRQSVGWIDVEDIPRVARETGRAYSTAEFQQRLKDRTAAGEPLDQAKRLFSLRRFDEAARALDEALASDPDDAEPLLLAGWANDTWSGKRPEKAVEFYRRLGARDDPNAAFTGLYGEFRLRIATGKTTEAVSLRDELLRRFPKILDRQLQLDIEGYQPSAKQTAKP